MMFGACRSIARRIRWNDRVLRRDDLDVRPVQLGERRVQRRRLAGPRRPRHEQDAVRTLDDRPKAFVVARMKTEVFQADQARAAVQKPHHQALPVRGGQGADADIQIPPLDLHPDTAVLRLALLRDVHAGHDLTAGQKRGLKPFRSGAHLAANAVDPEPNPDAIFHGFDVDIRSAVLHRVGNHLKRETNDGGVLLILLPILPLRRQLVPADLDFRLRAGRFFDRRRDGASVAGSVKTVDRLVDVLPGRQHAFHAPA
jgi:hypothetical protein